jgi:hypothetical protein
MPGDAALGLLYALVDQLGAYQGVGHAPSRLVAGKYVDVQRNRNRVLLESGKFDVRELKGGDLCQAERSERRHVKLSNELVPSA